MTFFDKLRVCLVSRPISAICVGLLFAAPVCRAASARPNHRARSPWVATWGAAMMPTHHGTAPDFSGKTLREIVHASIAGKQVRVWFSNRFGAEPLHIGAAHIALSTRSTTNEAGAAEDGGIQASSDRTLTFHHLGSVVIAPGATIVSDPVSLNVPALSNLSVSIYLPDHTMGLTEHELALETSYAATGNVVNAPSLAGKSWPEPSWYFLSGVDVDSPGDSAIIAFGDSITDGWRSTADENRRWPDDLARRLASDPGTEHAGVLGVVNVGISGNRVLLDGYGPNALSRIDRDVVARSGARYMIVLESINDIGRFASDHQPYGDLAQRLETGLTQLAMQAHQHGMLVFGATLTPYKGCGYYSPAGDGIRQAVNRWIRTTHVFDGVVDFDKAVRDPQHPLQFAPQYDSGDHLHPNDAGYKAMAAAIPLKLFTGNR